tara:strand:+ start:2911 stop:3117 length:207 start_codon:yes stop_codon:yes gene_type:complete
MNLRKHMEILDVSDHLGHTGDYEIRKYREGGGYVLLDVLGDFVIIEEDEVDNIFSVIYNDIHNEQTPN